MPRSPRTLSRLNTGGWTSWATDLGGKRLGLARNCVPPRILQLLAVLGSGIAVTPYLISYSTDGLGLAARRVYSAPQFQRALTCACVSASYAPWVSCPTAVVRPRVKSLQVFGGRIILLRRRGGVERWHPKSWLSTLELPEKPRRFATSLNGVVDYVEWV